MSKYSISVPKAFRRFYLLFLAAIFVATAAGQNIPVPRDVLGFTPGDDRKLASWAQTLDYFRKLDVASNRVTVQEIGKTTVGVPFVYATISAPENLRALRTYEQANARLADPRKIRSNDVIARSLIKQGKTIVLITCGIHSTEVGGPLSSMLIAHRLASSDEPQIQSILKNTIILLVPSLNPDGVDIVKNWYDKTLGTKFEGTSPPELYHKYVGHDNNRDWYTFSQVETQLTVDKILNVWHPQIVHDIHQQGEIGSRLFLPPYMKPVEPNVPSQIVDGFTELGYHIANDLRLKGYKGITTNTTYDAWTPARAYSHYHGGVRILSETASAKLATPTTVKFEDMRVPSDDGYDPKVESPNFGPLWRGGEWKLRDITDYMTTAAFSLLGHAAANREKWLTRFYEVGKEAVRPRKDGELNAYILPLPKPGPNGSATDAHRRRQALVDILVRGGVELYGTGTPVRVGSGFQSSLLIPVAQPYGRFAVTLLEKQQYPNLLDEKGIPIAPYDVTAHTLPLLMDVEAQPIFKPQRVGTRDFGSGSVPNCSCGSNSQRLALYRSKLPNMDEGWTRWILENKGRSTSVCCVNYVSISDSEIRNGIPAQTTSIVFPDQSPNQMLNGYARGAMPDELTGGVGKQGVENLKKFVEAGGTLVFLNRSSTFAIEQFDLPVKDVTRGLARKDFYIPGSILRTELDTTHPVAAAMQRNSIAWFENSPAFEIQTSSTASANNFKIIARYPIDPANVLLSGWALGVDRIAGKAAVVEFSIGKGKIFLFGFRPQYRGQSLATLPLLFNAISNHLQEPNSQQEAVEKFLTTRSAW
ncbi:MAG: M14 metallopeptidase family protein [Pyrinomonadaceae bacterium]